MVKIKFNQLGFVIIPLYVKRKDKLFMSSVDYKVDTGANCTTICKDWLVELGYDENWIKTGRLLVGVNRPTVASGLPIEDCYEVVLPEIHIGGWVGYNWPVITSLSVQFKFLLGTDSMQFFNWYFNYENDVCLFDLISGKRKLLFNQQIQTIQPYDEVKNET